MRSGSLLCSSVPICAGTTGAPVRSQAPPPHGPPLRAGPAPRHYALPERPQRNPQPQKLQSMPALNSCTCPLGRSCLLNTSIIFSDIPFAVASTAPTGRPFASHSPHAPTTHSAISAHEKCPTAWRCPGAPHATTANSIPSPRAPPEPHATSAWRRRAGLAALSRPPLNAPRGAGCPCTLRAPLTRSSHQSPRLQL